jgi:hypothetical protein
MVDVQEATYQVVMLDVDKHKDKFQEKQLMKELKQLLIMLQQLYEMLIMLNVVEMKYMVEFYSNESLMMMLKVKIDDYQMTLRDYLDMFLPKQTDDIALSSIDDENDHNHPNIFVYHHTKNNYIVYHDSPNMLCNQ